MKVPAPLVAVNSPEGAARLATQPASSLVWALLSHLTTQSTQSFCSLATSCTMLNALQTPAPIDPAFAPYPYFTHRRGGAPSSEEAPPYPGFGERQDTVLVAHLDGVGARREQRHRAGGAQVPPPISPGAHLELARRTPPCASNIALHIMSCASHIALHPPPS